MLVDLHSLFSRGLDDHVVTAQRMRLVAGPFAALARACVAALQQGNRILLFGNGGSAADAQHIAAELVGRFRCERRGLPAQALTVDSSALTAIANDYGWPAVFARQVAAQGRAGDVAIGITTSGASLNVLEALRLAQRLHLVTAALTGENGLAGQVTVDHEIRVPSGDTPRVQEMHGLLGHLLCEAIEANLMEKAEA